MTPREAQAQKGFDLPREAHQGMRAKQRDRMFSTGLAPSDEGLIESEVHIGNLNPAERSA